MYIYLPFGSLDGSIETIFTEIKNLSISEITGIQVTVPEIEISNNYCVSEKIYRALTALHGGLSGLSAECVPVYCSFKVIYINKKKEEALETLQPRRKH